MWSPCPLSVRLLTQFFCVSDCMPSDETYCYGKNVVGKGTCSQGLIGQACGQNNQCIDGRCEGGECKEKIALDASGPCNEARYVQVFTLLAQYCIPFKSYLISFFLASDCESGYCALKNGARCCRGSDDKMPNDCPCDDNNGTLRIIWPAGSL